MSEAWFDSGMDEAIASYSLPYEAGSSPDNVAQPPDGAVDRAYLLSMVTGEAGKTVLRAAITPSTQEQGEQYGNSN